MCSFLDEIPFKRYDLGCFGEGKDSKDDEEKFIKILKEVLQTPEAVSRKVFKSEVFIQENYPQDKVFIFSDILFVASFECDQNNSRCCFILEYGSNVPTKKIKYLQHVYDDLPRGEHCFFICCSIKNSSSVLRITSKIFGL